MSSTSTMPTTRKATRSPSRPGRPWWLSRTTRCVGAVAGEEGQMAQARAEHPPRSRIGAVGPADQVFRGVVTGFSGLVIAILAGLVVLLVLDSWPAIQRYGFGF